MAASVVRDLQLLLMLNKLNQADLQMEFTTASELKALSNIAPRFLTLLAVDISNESILILFMLMGFLRLLFISTKTYVLSMFSCNMLVVTQDLMSMTQFWMLLMICVVYSMNSIGPSTDL